MMCWQMAVHGIYRFFAFWWPAFAIYGTLYAIGAATFLLSLRLKSEDGKLTVNYDSLAYKLAHPVRWGNMKRDLERNPEFYQEFYDGQQGSICAFYAALFNMLLFIWPQVLLFWLLACTILAFVRFLIIGEWLVPDLREATWLREVKIWHQPVPPIAFVLPAAFLVWALWNFTSLMHVLMIIGMGLLCATPFLIGIAVVVFVTRKVYIAQPGETASAVKEVFIANKERFCKLVEYK